MISDSKKFIFIHIPKNGGTSINSILKEYCKFPPEISPGVHNTNISKEYQKHTKLLEIKNSNIDLSQYFKFTVIRNPWDRIVSLYFWNLQISIKPLGFKEKDFNSWIETVFVNKFCKPYWFNQIDYISIKDKINIDYIIRFESFQSGWEEICKKLNIQKNLPHEYKTNHKQYQKYYNDQSINIIQKMFLKDIKIFNYQF